jgi:hypothetical protein
MREKGKTRSCTPPFRRMGTLNCTRWCVAHPVSRDSAGVSFTVYSWNCAVQNALQARHKLSRHPDITRLIREHWKLLTAHKPTGDWTITKDEYLVYFMQCARVLMPDEAITPADILVSEVVDDSGGFDLEVGCVTSLVHWLPSGV